MSSSLKEYAEKVFRKSMLEQELLVSRAFLIDSDPTKWVLCQQTVGNTVRFWVEKEHEQAEQG